jgi:serine/threonine protein kinase
LTSSLIYSLVLYSRKHSAWKLADFGLASEGTSRNVHTTNNARGTAAYRAPELLLEDKPVYNNKVDIWSLGCILYELVIGDKPFNNDIAVLYHKLSGKELEINFDNSFEEDTRSCVAEHIHQMLQFEPNLRPSASSLLSDFIDYCRPSNSSQGNYVDIHHEFNSSRQLDSRTDFPLGMTSTTSGIFPLF